MDWIILTGLVHLLLFMILLDLWQRGALEACVDS